MIDGIAALLQGQPTVSSRAVKGRRPYTFSNYELRLGDFRILHRLDEGNPEVLIVPVSRKVGNKLIVDGQESTVATVIPLSDLQSDAEGVPRRCDDPGHPRVAELPDWGVVWFRPVDADDDLINQLIEHNPAFREHLANSVASPGAPFPFGGW